MSLLAHGKEGVLADVFKRKLKKKNYSLRPGGTNFNLSSDVINADERVAAARAAVEADEAAAKAAKVKGRRDFGRALAVSSGLLSIGRYAQELSNSSIKRIEAEGDAKIAEMAIDFERSELEASFEDKAAILAERTAQRVRATDYAYAAQGVSVDSDVVMKATDYEKQVANDDMTALRNRLTAQRLGLQLEEVNIGYNREIARLNEEYADEAALVGLLKDGISSFSQYYEAGNPGV